MGDKTGIEWTSATWNPLRGCSRVSDGCRHCYAETQAARIIAMDRGRGVPEGEGAYDGLLAKGGQWNGKIKLVPELLIQPVRWTKPRKIFVNSMSDLFHENVPFEYVAAVFAVMASTPRHTYQILTKRPKRMRDFFAWLAEKADGANERYINSEQHQAGVKARQALRDQGKASLDEPAPPTEMLRGLYDIAAPIVDEHMDQQARRHHLKSLGQCHWRNWPLDNVWLGVSVEDQATADERIPLLIETPAAVRWLSMEPLLGPVSLRWMAAWPENPPYTAQNPYNEGVTDHLDGLRRLDWVVVGGESGKDARPMHPQWAFDLRDQCAEAGVPFMFKQWGEWVPRSACYHILEDGTACSNRDPGAVQWPSVRLTEAGNDGHRLEHAGDGGDVYMQRVGKRAAGRRLQGILHDGYPA
ncbi:phage Gp37/Gp68 family protein [Modicisalibacter sp. MOD 31.J]|uniref:phage Gp37/Gp68 family protein n=1 Tax=Modicisalibacter sp. MOD 31.J TaxID=2831897 RepID=UPI001CCEA012|nr:phage Gp37/Gp68 family protein [Modicisalibacter sp. MOD 31.J]MBZ9574597.1 phage Gp37/Gp68 family protein [Modicisalibacter sp. MOD 31.J]